MKTLIVTFDSQLKFIQQINKCISKTKQEIGPIRRNFSFLDKTIFPILYENLKKPILEYCNFVWCTLNVRESETLEKVQRQATKIPVVLQGTKRVYIRRKIKDIRPFNICL